MATKNKSKEIVSQDIADTPIDENSTYNKDAFYTNDIHLPEGFTFASRNPNKVIIRDLNSKNRGRTSSLTKFTKEKVLGFFEDPKANEKNIREAVIYIYGISSHFRRLIQHFADLTKLAYVVSPCNLDKKKSINEKTLMSNYQKTLHALSSMDIKNQFADVITVCLREDIYFGTMWVSKDNITLQRLPTDYCKIAVIEDNVFNVSFDFSYFDKNKDELEMFPAEFNTKYKKYLKNKETMKWQELSSPTSFAIKYNKDILDYAMPPFAGILREIYDIEDYKSLKLAKTELENYAMLVMKLGYTDGKWDMNLDLAREFYANLDGVLPEEIGSVLSPMPIEKISFDRQGTRDTDAIAESEQHLYSAAGVSSLLFNNDKASANALTLSVKVDQSLTFSIVKSIEGVINRFLKHQPYGKQFKTTFLNCSSHNDKELGDMYIKACTYGLPMISYYAASQGMSQDEVDNMNYLENDLLKLRDRFVPLKSSSTQSGKEDGPGRKEKDASELTEAGEQTREDA